VPSALIQSGDRSPFNVRRSQQTSADTCLPADNRQLTADNFSPAPWFCWFTRFGKADLDGPAQAELRPTAPGPSSGIARHAGKQCRIGFQPVSGMMAMSDPIQFAALEIVRHSKAEIGFTTLS
jgi:hypothetical protein